VQQLARFAEPWHVKRTDDGIAVCDANGVVLVQLLQHRCSAAAIRCDTPLSDTEAAELARLIALLPVLWRRPQY
jgi:hypothetical protein